MAKVKGQTEQKLWKQAQSYLDALLLQLEGSLHNSNCSGLPRRENRAKVKKSSPKGESPRMALLSPTFNFIFELIRSSRFIALVSETCKGHTCNLAAILEISENL